MIDWKLFGQCIKLLRINANLTPPELGRRIGIESSGIYKLERDGHENKNIKILINICKALDIDFVNLLFICKTNIILPEEFILKKKLIKYYKLEEAINYDKDNINWKAIRQIIKQQRIKKKLRQIDLGKKVQLGQPSIYYIEESNYKPIKLNILRKICQALDIDVNELMENHIIKRSL